MVERKKLILIAGPCVVESKKIVFEIAEKVKTITEKYNIEYFFKASFDKANRSSTTSFRGLGMKKGLEILKEVKEEFNLKILTDVHETIHVDEVCEIVDVIQIPAFLCRQTDLLLKVSKAIKNSDKIINIKKGQFLAPWDMKQVVDKLLEDGLKKDDNQIWITERGTTFGYNSLVVDYRSLPQLNELGCKTIFDATHSVQQPGGQGVCSGGQREYVAPLSRAAIAVGVDGLFMEVHPNPELALSDGPNMVPLDRFDSLISQLIDIRKSVENGFAKSSI